MTSSPCASTHVNEICPVVVLYLRPILFGPFANLRKFPFEHLMKDSRKSLSKPSGDLVDGLKGIGEKHNATTGQTGPQHCVVSVHTLYNKKLVDCEQT